MPRRLSRYLSSIYLSIYIFIRISNRNCNSTLSAGKPTYTRLCPITLLDTKNYADTGRRSRMSFCHTNSANPIALSTKLVQSTQ